VRIEPILEVPLLYTWGGVPTHGVLETTLAIAQGEKWGLETTLATRKESRSEVSHGAPHLAAPSRIFLQRAFADGARRCSGSPRFGQLLHLICIKRPNQRNTKSSLPNGAAPWRRFSLAPVHTPMACHRLYGRAQANFVGDGDDPVT
jgi:hypothetical protein